jgi:anti-sigma factor RsiW
MNCLLETREEKQLLMDYCAHSLPPERKALVEPHLHSCSRCQEFVTSQYRLAEALELWQAPDISQDFNRRLYRRIDAENADASWWNVLVPRMLFRPVYPSFLRTGLPVAAAACLLVTAGVLLERPAVSPVPVSKDMAQVESVQPEQVEQALDTMDLLSEFSHHVPADGQQSKL